MKATITIAGIILCCLGFVMASGIEQNAWQGVCGVLMMSVAAWCINRADAMGKQAKRTTIDKHYKQAA